MASRRIRMFTVRPRIPERLQALQTIAYNLWWSWNHEAIALFRRIDEDLFESLENNPVKLLSTVSPERLQELQHDEGFLAHLDRVAGALDRYMRGHTWYDEVFCGRSPGLETEPPRTPTKRSPEMRIAYFSAEFGLHESIPTYSGGLGVLAGDHLKSASDLGEPLVGVGLMYRLGYFRQYLNHDGWQQERYPENDFFNLPLVPELGPDGKPILVSVPFPGRDVFFRIWRIQVGRVPLYLLDTNVPNNSPEDREITGQLYGGDQDMRIRQEIILGIGGIRALRALGIQPTVCHMNEGHSAFLALERIRIMMEEKGLSFEEARAAVTAGNVFTTHTPVPAGNDLFAPHLVEHWLGAYFLFSKLDKHTILALGRQNPQDPSEPFSMTVLALRLANVSNGVSKLHGVVSRRMWRGLWPQLPEAEVPIISITNGVHTQTWLSPEMAQLFDRYLGTGWRDKPSDHSIWKRVDNIPDAELWRTHERRRERLVVFCRKRVRWQLLRRGAPPAEIHRAEEILDPEALTIGFARRFATYKRGNLIFRNLERLTAIINNKDRPVQIIFSGKAHPRDHGGKELIAEIVHVARRPDLRRRIVFLEDYDMAVARYLVQGVDIWLNNPRRPLEASGTSGMKAAANAGIHMSVLDGWWAEGYARDNGYAIGAGEEYTDLNYQDDVESRAIYDLLEQEIVPAFFTRGSDGVPRQWVRMMKNSMKTLCPVFNTNRMLEEYMRLAYWPTHQHYLQMIADDAKPARNLVRWRRHVEQHWPQITVESVEAKGADGAHVGEQVPVLARIRLGPLAPEDVEVQLVHGLVDSLGEIATPNVTVMQPDGKAADGVYIYRGHLPCKSSGQHGYAVRILPRHEGLANPLTTGLITWG
ncbi:MAG: alpha-glucan family phosphorylase [Gemmatales bacterium]|nr:alpha-glucan family phosphorylase [Gemmatales bacterium]MDW8388333.1 alpha-glucan family phosphorylase [Gemmatales bacterium]